MEQKTIYLTKTQSDWLSNQPRSFKLSSEIRKVFDDWMGSEKEDEKNERKTD